MQTQESSTPDPAVDDRVPCQQLLAAKTDVFEALARASKKKVGKKIRDALRRALARHLGREMPPVGASHGALRARVRFEFPGIFLWDALAHALVQPNPRDHRGRIEAAYAQFEAGLGETQLARARVLEEQAAQWESQQQEERARQAQALRKRQEEAERARLERERVFAAEKQAFVEMARALAATCFGLEQFDALAGRYRVYFGENLTVLRAAKRFGLSPERQEQLAAAVDARKREEAERAAREREEARRRRDWEWSLVPSFRLPEQLGITKTEYQRWLADKRLVPALYRDFRKWGQNLQLPLFDPAVLAKITPEVVAQWRARDADKAIVNRKRGAVKGAAKAAKTRAIKGALALHDYAQDFAAARGMKRRFELCLGPTNSGKTHMAMEALAAAESGVYLAPLRLLALENYERLKARGVAVSLMTGEERIIDPAARHVCATVEMCDFTTPVAVAVVDEVQMLGDAQRGWAWTAALLGVPAQQVFACGAPYAREAVLELLGQTGEAATERAFERLTPLLVEDAPITLKQVQAGDALVAFTRRDVLQFAALLRQRGLRVSVIYGALSPEVRRAQAHEFASGATDVVVATDAIGMGLNLPIRRIVFTSVHKYDGVRNRSLQTIEVLQIAGRAGRFGLHESGFVTAFGADDLQSIREGLRASPEPLASPFSVMPTWQHVQTVLHEMRTTDVVHALEFFERISFGGIFTKTDLQPSIARARLAQGIARGRLSSRAIFDLACAPADTENEIDSQMLSEGVQALAAMECMDLPYSPVPLDGGKVSAAALQEAEGYARELALFSWLGCKFPGLADFEFLAEQREALTLFINRALLAHKGDFVRRKRKRYRWDEEFEFEP